MCKRLTLALSTHVGRKWKVGKRYSMQNGNQKRVGVAIFISDNMDFQSKYVTGDKDDLSIVIKDSIHQGGMIIVNKYIPDIGYSKSTRLRYSTFNIG